MKLYNDWEFDWSTSLKKHMEHEMYDYNNNNNNINKYRKKKIKSSKFQFIIVFISIIVLCILWTTIETFLVGITHPEYHYFFGQLGWIILLILFLITAVLPVMTFGFYGSLMTAQHYCCLNIVSTELNKCLCNVNENENINKNNNNDDGLKIDQLLRMIAIMKIYPITVTLFGFLISFKQMLRFISFFLLARFVTFMLQQWQF